MPTIGTIFCHKTYHTKKCKQMASISYRLGPRNYNDLSIVSWKRLKMSIRGLNPKKNPLTYACYD